MEHVITILKALADRNRLRILKMLQHKEMCVCELAYVLGITQPSVSRHLKKMKDAGLIDSRQDGFWSMYFLAPEHDLAQGIISELEQLADDPQVCEDREKAGTADRVKLCCRPGDKGCNSELEKRA